MKFIIFILIMLSFPFPALCGEWKMMDSTVFVDEDDPKYTRATHYKQIDCINSTDCFTMAVFGFAEDKTAWPWFRVSRDGGETWRTTLIDSAYTYYDDEGKFRYYLPHASYEFSYPSERLCIVVCDSGYYWRSTDNCETWTEHKLETNNTLREVHFINDSVGVVASYYEFFCTTDGGESFIRKEFPDEKKHSVAYDIKLLDEKTIIAAVTEAINYNRHIIKSTDFGDTWTYTTSFINSNTFNDMYFINPSEGWMAGMKKIANLKYNNLIYHTTDGGISWEQQLDTGFTKAYSGLTKIKFWNEREGTAIGEFMNIWTTTNGGENWFKDPIFPAKLNVSWGDFTDVERINGGDYIGVAYMSKTIYKYFNTTSVVSDFVSDATGTLSIYPNPFRGNATIEYSIINPGHYKLIILDFLGREIQTLADEWKEPGTYKTAVSGDGLPSGIYYYKLISGRAVRTGKMVIVR